MGKNKQANPPAQGHEQSKKEHSSPSNPTAVQQIVWVINIIVAIMVVCYLLSQVVTKNYNPIFLFESAKKRQLLQSFGLFISLLLAMHSFSADWLEIVFNKTQNDLYRTHRNVISNTLQWSIVFLGAYLYKGDEVLGGTGLDIRLFDLFLISRVIFSIGYVIGALVGHQSLRLVGFGLGFGCIVIMLTEVLGHSILEYFK